MLSQLQCLECSMAFIIRCISKQLYRWRRCSALSGLTRTCDCHGLMSLRCVRCYSPRDARHISVRAALPRAYRIVARRAIPRIAGKGVARGPVSRTRCALQRAACAQSAGTCVKLQRTAYTRLHCQTWLTIPAWPYTGLK